MVLLLFYGCFFMSSSVNFPFLSSSQNRLFSFSVFSVKSIDLPQFTSHRIFVISLLAPVDLFRNRTKPQMNSVKPIYRFRCATFDLSRSTWSLLCIVARGKFHLLTTGFSCQNIYVLSCYIPSYFPSYIYGWINFY